MHKEEPICCSSCNFRRQNLLAKFQCEGSAVTIVLLLRLITAIEVHMWRTAYLEVVLGGKYSNLVEFCTGEVLPIGNKHVHAAVLSEALGVPIRVVDLTPAPPSSSERSTEDIPYYTAANTGSGSASSPTATRKRAMARFEITLLYKPDNCYDILYPFPDVTCCGYPIPDEVISYWGLDR
uniref:Uncharacterized protein n=1 Tax=Ananas comosus var. bracteatus TaxID=296719 RepID=A0A6V7NPK0_ANACO|nr:unnamed protein product [Ananas comosus var. bracteatus]